MNLFMTSVADAEMVSEFVKVSPRLVKKGMHQYHKSLEENWRFELETYREKFRKDTKELIDKFFRV